MLIEYPARPPHQPLHLLWAMAAVLIAMVVPCPASAQAALDVTGLRTGYLTDPVGIDGGRPRLSWRLESTERNTIQSAYQIQVAVDSTDLELGTKLLWDSGRVASDASLFQAYAGPALQSRTRYRWRVRVWNGGGHVSPWSRPAFWETGLLARGDWSARWIRPPTADHDSAGAPAPMLRRAFDVKGPVRWARVYVTSLGLYELHLNGQRVSRDLFTPGWTSYTKRLQYQTYDVTRLLVSGENAIGAILGDGWYRGFLGFDSHRNVYGSRVALLLQLEIRYADGSTTRLGSDAGWKTATGPILGSDIYNGESYDARRERTGWASAHYDDRGWHPVELADAPTAELVAPVSEPVRRAQALTPIAIIRSPAGETIFDLGQNITGWVRLRVRGPAGTTVTLRHAEVLDTLGDLYTGNLRGAAQIDRYTLKGDGDEVYEPHFTYHGFRYVAVEGLPGPPTLGTVTGIVVHSDLAETGEFVTSDTLLNKLQHNILWGQRGNFLDVPTDCPQRNERLGWTGDAQVFARTASFNLGVEGFFAKWLDDVSRLRRS